MILQSLTFDKLLLQMQKQQEQNSDMCLCECTLLLPIFIIDHAGDESTNSLTT